MSEEPVGYNPTKVRTLLSNRVYDRLKFVAMVLLPVLGALFFLAAQFSGWAHGDVVGTIVLADAALGVFLYLSSIREKKTGAMYDGEILVFPNHEEETTDLHINFNPERLENGSKQVILKIEHQ